MLFNHQQLLSNNRPFNMTVPSDIWSSVKYYLNLLHLSLRYQVTEFFQCSTLHGVKYIAETDRPFAERFIWFILTATGTISALVIIASLWDKFQNNPTITGLDTNTTARMTFPTVLVCPEEPFDDEAVTELAFNQLGGQKSDLSVDYEEFLRQLMRLTVNNLQDFYYAAQNITQVKGAATLNHLSLRHLLLQMRVKCEKVFEFCNFKETDLDCCDHFKPIFTELGFCYGLNLMYTHSETTTDDVLQRNAEMLELQETDKKWSLVIYPKLTSKIYIHSQLEVSSLEMATPTVTWNTDHSIDILITMKETITTEDTKQLSIGWV